MKNIEKKDNKQNKILAIVLIFALLFIIAFFLNTDIASKENTDKISTIKKSNEIKFSVILKIDNGSGEKKEYNLNNITKQTTIFDILKNNTKVKYNNNYKYGVFIESINGIKNGHNGKYWQYYVNGILGDVAADKKVLKEGDNVEWKFEKVSF